VPGRVHESFGAPQYPCNENLNVLHRHQLIHNQVVRRFRTKCQWREPHEKLKREEIYANRCEDLRQMRLCIEEFIEEQCYRKRLHSAWGTVLRKNSNRRWKHIRRIGEPARADCGPVPRRAGQPGEPINRFRSSYAKFFACNC
jgi:hypothetical protein